MQSCWDIEPQDRPSFRHIVKTLEGLKNDYDTLYDAATNDEKDNVEDNKDQVDEDDASDYPLKLNIEKAETLGKGETDRTELQV